MAVQKYTLRIDAAHRGARLDLFLKQALPKALGRDVSNGQLQKLIEAGAVRLNGRPERSLSRSLAADARLEVFADVAKFGAAAVGKKGDAPSKTVNWTPGRILFEDEWLIAVDKPVGLPTQPTLDAARPNVFTAVRDYLQKRDGGTPYLGLHHRLDRDTSGVLLFTKDQKANAGVAELFSSRSLQKTYQALSLCRGGCPDAWDVENHLGVVTRAGKDSKFGAVRSGGDPAHTSFKVLERFAGAALVEARPHTGRTHQIRVHLSEGGYPILGDSFYGGPVDLRRGPGPGLAIPRVMLHAASLVFTHPLANVPVEVRSPWPEDFAACVKQLRAAVATP